MSEKQAKMAALVASAFQNHPPDVQLDLDRFFALARYIYKVRLQKRSDSKAPGPDLAPDCSEIERNLGFEEGKVFDFSILLAEEMIGEARNRKRRPIGDIWGTEIMDAREQGRIAAFLLLRQLIKSGSRRITPESFAEMVDTIMKELGPSLEQANKLRPEIVKFCQMMYLEMSRFVVLVSGI